MTKRRTVLSLTTTVLAPAAALTLVVGLVASGSTGRTAPPAPATTSATASAGDLAPAASRSADVRVATFNIQSAALDRTHGAQHPWRVRRSKVIGEILHEHVDVIGVQEAAPGRSGRPRYVAGANQYLDLRNGLNRAGGHYRLSSAAGYNCHNSRTARHCHRQDRNASNGDRILYNSRKLQLLGRNAMAYSHRSKRNPHPFLAWARFRVRSNGHQFRFFTTHLDPRKRGVRKAQWKQMIHQINRTRDGRPTISVGDFNTQKFDPMAHSMFPAMKRSGYGEVLNERYRVNPNRHVRARHRTNAWISSLNHLHTNVRLFGYEGSRHKTGNSIDHIFASNSLRVLSYKLVLSYNPKTLRVRGVLPSDHNMVCATIAI